MRKASFVSTFAVAATLLLQTVFIAPCKAQAPVCTANWWAYCCVCAKCFVVTNYPKNFGHCRHCNLMCGDCRKKYGDLRKALEDLKTKNRILYAKYRGWEQKSLAHNEKMRESQVSLYGAEGGHWNQPSTWTLSGFNSSAGKFAVAAGGLATNFGGGFGAAILFDGLSLVQSTDFFEYEGGIASTTIDVLTEEEIVKLYSNDIDLGKASWKYYDALRKGTSPTAAWADYNRQIRKIKNLKGGYTQWAGDKFNLAADVWGTVTALADLVTDIDGIYTNYKAREEAEREREKIQLEIEANVKVMTCMKETIDSLDKGGLSQLNKGQGVFMKTQLSILLPAVISNYKFSFRSTNGNYWEIDSTRLRSARRKAIELQGGLEKFMTILMEEVIPPVIPWALGKHQELKPAIRQQLMKQFRLKLGTLKTQFAKIEQLKDKLIDDLMNIIIGYETFYLTDMSGSRDNAPQTDSVKWISTQGKKLAPGLGRLNMVFPGDAEWSIDIYSSNNKFITNKSKVGKIRFHDLKPGRYNIKLYAIPVSINIEPGQETRLKVGILEIGSAGHWDIHDAQKKKYFTSGNKRTRLVIPAGSYNLNFEGQDHKITVQNGQTLRFQVSMEKLMGE